MDARTPAMASAAAHLAPRSPSAKAPVDRAASSVSATTFGATRVNSPKSLAHATTKLPMSWLSSHILVRGHGFLHPRAFGVACHTGLLAGVSTCGVADSLLRVDGVDEASVVSRARASLALGSALPIVGASGTVWGAALRANTEPKFRPTYVSAGPGVSLATAVKLAVACRRYRVPEPVRLAELEGRVALRERVVD